MLYGCFIDFQKTFDSVNRKKLWNFLKTNGIKGNILELYVVCTKAWKRVLGLMESILNVLIVLLDWSMDVCYFSIFVNELAKLIENSDTRNIVISRYNWTVLLLYADDIALILDTIKGLQRQWKSYRIFVKYIKWS